MAKIVILGAGLTGLSSAYHLEKSNFNDYKIFEKEKEVGGLCKSVTSDGFTFDYTGHLLHIKSPYFKNFLEDTAGNLEKTFNLHTRRSFIYSNNIYTPYPFQTNLYGLPSKTIAECIEGYVKRKKQIRKPQSFYEWTLKYFGSGIGKHFMFPYNKKLWAYDTKKIHPSWTGRFVPQTSLKKIIEGAVSKSSKTIGYNASFYYPKEGGIGYLPNAMAKKITKPIHKGYKATKIDLLNKVVFFENGHQEKFETLISTLPLKELLKRTKEGSSTNLKSATNKLLCTSLVNFNIGVKHQNLSEKHWIYFPEKQYPFYRIGFWQNFSKNIVPQNYSAIYGELSYLPGTRTKKQIQNLTQKSIKQFLNVFVLKKEDIKTEKILHIDYAYAIYDLWRAKNLDKLHKRLNEESIYSIGRYGEWKYSSMEEAILDGKNAVEKILNSNRHSAPKGATPSNASHCSTGSG